MMSGGAYANKFKNKYLYLIIGVLLTIAAISSYIYFAKTAYAISIDNKVIGVVRNQEEVDSIIEEIKDEMKNKYNKEMKLSQELNIKKTRVKNDDLTSTKDIKSNLYVSVKYYTPFNHTFSMR
jgi:hypothetical protein